jgi:hypothetical protein
MGRNQQQADARRRAGVVGIAVALKAILLCMELMRP